MANGEPHRLQFAGDLDLATCPVYADKVRKAFADGARSLVLDLSQVSFIDSSGLRVIGDAVSQSRQLGGTVTVHRPPPVILRTLRIAGLDSLVQVTGVAQDPV